MKRKRPREKKKKTERKGLNERWEWKEILAFTDSFLSQSEASSLELDLDPRRSKGPSWSKAPTQALR